jgi:hypothetical protein
MKYFSVLVLLIFTTSFKPIDCPCNFLGTADHKRDKVKNRPPANANTATTIPFQEILKMKIKKSEKDSIKANEDREVFREKKVVSVTGYAWVIKLSDDDCDVHIEMSEKNSKNAKRIIAEIPNTSDYCQLHNRITEDLVSKFHLNKKKDYRFDKTDNGGKPIKLTVTGYLFWDSGHPTNKNHGTKQVGSVWEIHPVSQLKWEQ